MKDFRLACATTPRQRRIYIRWAIEYVWVANQLIGLSKYSTSDQGSDVASRNCNEMNRVTRGARKMNNGNVPATHSLSDKFFVPFLFCCLHRFFCPGPSSRRTQHNRGTRSVCWLSCCFSVVFVTSFILCKLYDKFTSTNNYIHYEIHNHLYFSLAFCFCFLFFIFVRESGGGRIIYIRRAMCYS